MSKLYFKYGVMGASKTAEALMTKFRYEEIGQKCLFCKSEVDARDGERTVKSRIGLSAENVMLLNEIFSIDDFSKYDVIIVDEAQFATKEQIDSLALICDKYGIPVICYGLKSDFLGNLFEGSKRLFEIADKLEEIKQICWCGRKALFNARIVNGSVSTTGNLLELGGDDKYVALCRKHYISGKWNSNV